MRKTLIALTVAAAAMTALPVAGGATIPPASTPAEVSAAATVTDYVRTATPTKDECRRIRNACALGVARGSKTWKRCVRASGCSA